MLDVTPDVTKVDLPATSSVERVHAADVTGDGLQDVLAVDAGLYNGGKGSVWLLEGLAGDLYQPAVSLADIDGDSLIDLIVADSNSTSLRPLANRSK